MTRLIAIEMGVAVGVWVMVGVKYGVAVGEGVKVAVAVGDGVMVGVGVSVAKRGGRLTAGNWFSPQMLGVGAHPCRINKAMIQNIRILYEAFFM